MRQAIVTAARLLLEERGVEQAVTLRAVARGAGITAPSIYNHFGDLAAVLEAVVGEAFEEFATATGVATEAIGDPLERLRAAAHAYLQFAARHPATYRLIFTRPHPSRLPLVAQRAAENHRALVESIAACAGHGRPAQADPDADAAVFWSALHGTASLQPAHPRFTWPAEDELVERLLRTIVLRDPRHS